MLLAAAPKLMRVLAVVGTAAMFLVGGGILVHGIPALHHLVEAAAAFAPRLEDVATLVANLLIGMVAGGILVAAVAGGRAAWQQVRRRMPT
jgi:predicted DNA repair protein MutK